MNASSFRKAAIRSALIAGALVPGYSAGAADAAPSDVSIQLRDSDSFAATVADAVITARVKARLNRADGFQRSAIDVTTRNGVVRLDGSASSANAKSEAESVTRSVDGVKSIDNNLTTPAGSGESVETRDTVTRNDHDRDLPNPQLQQHQPV
jgi:hyperosmotically inducible protein